MNIINIFYIPIDKWWIKNDYLLLSIENDDDIKIDMDIIIDEIDEKLKKDENWKNPKTEFNYLIDECFDFYLNPDDTIDVRITDLKDYAYHVTLSLEKLINKVI
jgi:hypothetical protein